MSAAIAAAKPQPRTAERRIVKLQVNTSGAWRNVMDFDIDVVDQAEVLHLAASLFAWDACDSVSLRVIVPGDTAPLMTWTRKNGWLPWRNAA